MVPHVPSSMDIYTFNFWHTCGERYEDSDGTMHECNNTCEDPKCAAQWPVFMHSIEDHLKYMGMCMGPYCGTCAKIPEEVTV
jgi:hypothetical protein